MITVYQAQSSIDANIIQDILSIEGISSHVMGGYLEGGVGELQPYGLIRVMADEKDFQAAKIIIEQWQNEKPELEATEQSVETTDTPSASTNRKPLLAFTIALFIFFFYFLSLR